MQQITESCRNDLQSLKKGNFEFHDKEFCKDFRNYQKYRSFGGTHERRCNANKLEN